MNGASKILTVSYGTFSCTLEGFDDPFNTMKAIAEYFRDLAAGDRYFGAEPPTPDAAMLHQIAEREIQRRVEAKIQENGVVLRATDLDGSGTEGAVARPAAAPAVAAPTPAPVAAAMPANVTATTVQEAPVPQAPVADAPAETVAAEVARPSLAPASESAAESVVERLSRLRSEIAAQPAETTAAATSPVLSFAIPEYLEDQHADVLDPAVEQALADFLPEAGGDAASDLPEEAEASPAPEMTEVAEEFDIAALTEALDAEAEADVADPGMAAETLIAEGAAEDTPVAVMEAADEAQAGPLPDAPATEEAEADLDVALADSLRAALDGTDMPDSATADQSKADMAAEDMPDAALADEAEDQAQDSTEPDEAAQSDEALFASLGAVLGHAEAEATSGTIAVAEESEGDAPAAGETAPESDGAWPEAAEGVPAEQGDPSPAAETPAGMELRPGAAEKLQRARARVIRIRRGEELEVKPAEAQPAPAISPDAFAEIEEETAAEAPAPRPEAASPAPATIGALLSAEDEAELQRELAALRLGGADREELSETAAPAAQADARKPFEGASADDAVGRLMQQTDTEMAGSENKRRQSAIAHLKAAVAATVADRKVTGDKTGEAETVSRLARYRNDLAMVVKAALPGRSSGTEAQAERPAPLVLVSEQRIDRPRPAPAPQAPAGVSTAPIRPRRVTTGGLGMATAADLDLSDEDGDEDLSNLFGDSRGFAEFVERVGATSLEQILEASAAYLAGIEGRSHFSRPQLMQHLSAVVPQGSYQREDGLRSFGSLLRNGRFAKVRRGQFTLSDESAYLAEARKIAG